MSIVLYRTKAAPSQPHQIKFPFKGITAPAGYVLSPAQCLATGEYRDISPTPTTGYQLGTVPTWDEATGTVTMDVVAIPAPLPLTDLEKKSLITAISNAAKTLVEDQANAALQIQQWENYKSTTPHPYVIANINWGKAIYMEAEIRKSQVQAGIADDYVTLCDFSSFGEKPYTVYQLYTVGVVEI